MKKVKLKIEISNTTIMSRETNFEEKQIWEAKFPMHTIQNFDFNGLLEDIKTVTKKYYV